MIHTDPDLAAAVGPRVRKSPYFDATVRAGLTEVSTYNHMWLPMSYGDADAEYRRLTTGVSMWDVAAQRHVLVDGADAGELVQLLTAIDVSSLRPGRARYAPVVDHDGVLLNDPVLLRMPDGSWRFSIADADVRLWFAAIAHGVGLDASVTELDTATLAVQGPDAGAVAADLGIGWFDELDHFDLREATVASIPLVLSRSGWSTEGGFELFLDDPDRAEELWDAVAAAGESHGIGPGAPNAPERIENALLSYGTDSGYHADPIELGLESHLDLDGPPFIGQDALRRIRADGPRRRLRGVVIEGEGLGVLPHPVPFLADGEPVGELRAAASSPRFGRDLGLALVDAACEPGTVGTVALLDGNRKAELVTLPFEDSLDGR
ncbi:MAG: glycine cleavage T C-terminal barrel domain-containing protein [Actinomycetota bacterium]|nr:glycine cleavage T C-terminal barrel domain-containing protein [Actinomycetota bacterium]